MLKSDCVSLVFKVANFFTVRLSEHNHGCCFLWGNPDWFVFTQDHKLCVRVFLSPWLTRPHDMMMHTREGRCPEGQAEPFLSHLRPQTRGPKVLFILLLGYTACVQQGLCSGPAAHTESFGAKERNAPHPRRRWTIGPFRGGARESL